MVASTLFVTLCSLAQPANCHEERFTMDGANVLSCQAVAPFAIPAVFSDFLGEYAVDRWLCEPVETVSADK